jgi:hypothetical protein
MRKYVVQVDMINYRQVEIESSEPLHPDQIAKLAAQQARVEFGNCDDVVMVTYSTYGILVPAGQETTNEL